MTQLAAGWWEGFELYANQGFRKHHSEIEASSEWTKWLAFSAAWSRGTAINYYPAPGISPFLGRFDRCERRVHGASYGPHAHRRNVHLQRTQDYGWHLGIRQPHRAVEGELPVHTGSVGALHPRLQFGVAEPVADQFDNSKHVGVDALFTYMLNPGTALHVGYTDLYDNWRLYPGISPELKRTVFPDLNTGRQFFVKLSYLFRF